MQQQAPKIEPVQTKLAEPVPKIEEIKTEVKADAVLPSVEADESSDDSEDVEEPTNKLITIGRRSTQMPTYAKQL